MTPPQAAVAVVSARRFLGEALLDVLTADRDVNGVHVTEVGALRELVQQPPVNVLLDLDEPGIALADLQELDPAPGTRMMAFYDTFTARHAEQAFSLGVAVLFPLTAELSHVVGSVFGARTTAATAAQGLTRDELVRLATLTAREMEVLQHLAAGHGTKAVAHLLGITTHTVETHKRRLFRKLGVQQQGHAVAMAVAGGVVAAADRDAQIQMRTAQA